MKHTLTTVVLLTVLAQVANALPALVLPYSTLPYTEVQTTSLPKLLRDALLTTDEFSQGTDALPATLHVCRIDLNRDGIDEFIVDSLQSYSGGSAHVVFQRRRQHYAQIAYYQGGFYLGSPVHGYYQICAAPQGQRSEYVLYILRYSRGEYHEVQQRHPEVA